MQTTIQIGRLRYRVIAPTDKKPILVINTSETFEPVGIALKRISDCMDDRLNWMKQRQLTCGLTSRHCTGSESSV